MNLRHLGIASGIILHLGLAGFILTTVLSHHRDVAHEHTQLLERLETDRAQTQALEQQVLIDRAKLEGLRDDDPYIVEFMARERGYRSSTHHEIIPPPPEEPSSDE